MTLLGMDVDLVSGVATQLDGQASAIGTAASDIDRLVESAVSQWFGTDAQKFVQEWQTQHRPALITALEAIAQLSATARRNVGEQEQASNGTAAGCAITPEGTLQVCPTGVTTGTSPTDVPGLLKLVTGAYTQPGGVSVTFTGSGADRQAIVSVSGTEAWNFGGTNPDDMTTNVKNAFGIDGVKDDEIREAMREAGVTPSDKVLLVGHSQGGADAIRFASDSANTSTYNITGVVTAGAPDTVEYPKSNIPVLELRSDGDVVPALGAASVAGVGALGLPGAVIGHAVHDATLPSNVRVVDLPGGWEVPWQAHKLDNYIDDASHATDPAVSDFVNSNREFFSGAPSTTYTYSAQRVGDGFHRYE